MKNYNLIKNHIFSKFFKKNIRINNYSIIYSKLKNKHGLEIGGPSTIFEKGCYYQFIQ